MQHDCSKRGSEWKEGEHGAVKRRDKLPLATADAQPDDSYSLAAVLLEDASFGY